MIVSIVFLLGAIGGQPYSGRAQDKTAEPKNPTAPLVAKWLSPVSMTAGGKQTFKIQGLRLRDVDDLNCRIEGIAIKVLKTEAIKPGKDETKPELDSSVEFEVTLAPEIAAGELPLVLKSPQGTVIAPFAIRVLDETNAIEQREPANGFKDAQPLELGNVVRGSIDTPRDVDVFRMNLKQSETVVLEIVAARAGSRLDGILTIYDDRGRTLASNDDHDGSRDPRLEFTPPRDGGYFLSLIDALDDGGEMFSYVLKSNIADRKK